MRRLPNWDSFVNLKTLFHQLLIDMPYMHGVGRTNAWMVSSGELRAKKELSISILAQILVISGDQQ